MFVLQTLSHLRLDYLQSKVTGNATVTPRVQSKVSRFPFLAALNVNTTVLWDMRPCTLVHTCRRFGCTTSSSSEPPVCFEYFGSSSCLCVDFCSPHCTVSHPTVSQTYRSLFPSTLYWTLQPDKHSTRVGLHSLHSQQSG